MGKKDKGGQRAPKTCTLCWGNKKVPNGDSIHPPLVDCPRCGGSGKE
jgi:hypothetical protein